MSDLTHPNAGARRRSRLTLILVAVAVVVAAAAATLWLARRPPGAPRGALTGYIQAETLYLASPIAGPVAQVMVARGQRVAAGAPLFAMDVTTLAAGRELAGARVAQARAEVGQEVAGLARARAELEGAATQAKDSAADLARYLAVDRLKPGAVSRQQIDAARTAAAEAAARRDAAAKGAEALAAQVEAAKAQVVQEGAGLIQAQTQLDQLVQRAPAPGRIEDVMFQAGEWAPPSQPVVSLIPDGKVKVRFYVPEGERSRYVVGALVSFSCDGCARGLTARVDFVSPSPEYTPPIIYSRQLRTRLVFMVEARPTRPGGLSPGQPVDVEPVAGGATAADQ